MLYDFKSEINLSISSEFCLTSIAELFFLNSTKNFNCLSVISQMVGNVFVYGKLRVWGRGFSEGKSEAGKRATNFVLAKTSNFLYTVL